MEALARALSAVTVEALKDHTEEVDRFFTDVTYVIYIIFQSGK